MEVENFAGFDDRLPSAQYVINHHIFSLKGKATEATLKVRRSQWTHADTKSRTMTYWGTDVVPVLFLEVTPIVWPDRHDAPHHLTNFLVKHFLQKKTNEAQLSFNDDSEWIKIEWVDTSIQKMTIDLIPYRIKGQCDNVLAMGYLWKGKEVQRRVLIDSSSQKKALPLFFLPSNDPAALDSIPCVLRGYASKSLCTPTKVRITDATLVRILPPQPAHLISTQDQPLPSLSSSCATTRLFRQHLLGESGQDFLSPQLQAEVLANHNPDTLRELSLRMSMQLSRGVNIGTTKDAFSLKKQAITRSLEMHKSILSRLHISNDSSIIQSAESQNGPIQHNVPSEPSLLVHSPNHADGKTMLVQGIAQTIGCSRIHIIRPGPLLAKYGIHADTALESLLHGILVSAAAQSTPICIILDTIDAMMPPQLSGRSGAGDAAVPVFNAIASYFRNVAVSMQRSNEFPFPLKNALYNVGGSGGKVLSVHFCLVGIVTCPDDGWRSSQRGRNSTLATGNGSSTILDALAGGRYRLPTLTALTRWTAFCKALERSGIVLDDKSRKRLSILAASAAWAKGSAFQRVANALVQKRDDRSNGGETASIQDLEESFTFVQLRSAAFAHVSFQASQDPESDAGNDDDDDDMFASVGGNSKAKRSLEDALAIDPEKRRMLATFGLSPPTGILLYGPPGCGKTLLAKAVARLLKAPSGGTADSALPLGGTFISLGSSDLVRAEIGTSEKMLVSAFDFADKNAPSVVFLDEFQALFVERSRGGSGKLASTLLQCLDDIKRWKSTDTAPTSIADENEASVSNRVVVLGATNTPWMVDSAFLRPERFDRVVHVGLPTQSERESILNVHACRMKIRGKGDHTSLRALCQTIAGRTSGFSGADIAALCRAAAIRALDDGKEDCWIDDSHFLLALDVDVRASSDSRLVERLLKWKP